MQIKLKVLEIIIEVCDHLVIKEDDFDKTLKQVGIDSLETSNILLNIEEEYDITIPDEDINRVDTINKLIDYVTKKVEK